MLKIKMVQGLLDMIRNRARAEYDMVLGKASSKQRDKLTTIVNQLKLELGIQNYDQMRAYLLKRDYFYAERLLKGPQECEDFCLGKILKRGKGKSKKYDEYDWFIIATKDNDFRGIQSFENYDSKDKKIFFYYTEEGVAADRTLLEERYDGYWWFYIPMENVTHQEMTSIKSNLTLIIEYKHIARLINIAKRESGGDLGKAREIFIERGVEEAMNLELFYSYPIRIDHYGSPQEEIEFRRFLTELANYPSYSTLLQMLHSSPISVQAKGALKVFELFSKKGYNRDWFKNADISQISEVAKELEESLHLIR